MSYPPFEIIPYSINALCAIAERVTRFPFHRAKQKRQISYVNNFFSHWADEIGFQGPSKITMVIENHYIDSHYLEDYAQYFVKCFNKYPRDCVRIHFFINSELNYGRLREMLNGEGGSAHEASRIDEIEKLNKKYLGYLVVRPLPDTFIAKACLRPYPQFFQDSNRSLIKRAYKVSLFGVPLVVESVAFQEKDKVLSACATSALWSFFHAHQCVNFNSLPSAIAITKSAYPENAGSQNVFPNAGLTIENICRSIRDNRLEPWWIDVEGSKFAQVFLEIIYAYCFAGLPLILGVNVRELSDHNASDLKSAFSENACAIGEQALVKKEQEESQNKSHAVTILGFGLSPRSASDEGSLNRNINFRANRISRLYIHDDRTGPYARLLIRDGKWIISIDRSVSKLEIPEEEYFPTNLIAGVYHKIRIHYLSIKKTCESLVSRLFEIIEDRFDAEPDARQLFADLLHRLEWDIHLIEVSKFKERIRKNNAIVSGKVELLLQSSPRYIWSATTRDEDSQFFELFFDATDIPQGDAFLGVIHYDTRSVDLFDMFEEFCRTQFSVFQGNPKFDNVQTDYIWGIVTYFRKKNSFSQELNERFGELKDPLSIKDHETDQDAIADQNADRITSRTNLTDLDPKKNYIWVIDKDGVLVLGTEEENGRNGTNGHPTLLCGGPGRIAGELNFDRTVKDCSGTTINHWKVNSKSGRYSYGYQKEGKDRFLKNAVADRFELFFGVTNIFEVEPSKW